MIPHERQPHALPDTVCELVRLLLSTFPAPIIWAYPGAYGHLVSEIYYLLPHLLQHAEQRLREPLFLDVSRLSAVMLEDIANADAADPTAETVSVIAALGKIMRRAGLSPLPGSSENGSFSTRFFECAKGWKLDDLAALLESRWDWSR